MHADPKHRWDIATVTVKEALASWKGKAVKAAMDEEIRSHIGMGTWELVERPPRVYGANYDKKYAPVSSYVTRRIFLSIVAILDLNLMQVNMKNAFIQSKLDRVLCMYQMDYFNVGTGRVCKLLKSLYGLKQSPLVCAGWKKSQVNKELYFKVGDDGKASWVLVYVDDLLANSSSTAMLKELLEAAFELREISPMEKYLGLEMAPHPQAQHPQAPHPQDKHPQTRHPQTQHPHAPHHQTQHPQTQHQEQHLSRHLPQQAHPTPSEMASWKSTGTYVDAVPPSRVNIVDGMWIFRVKRPPGSPPAFKARYVARGFSQRQGVDYFLTFSPTPKMTTLWVLLHVAAQRDYKLHSLDFSTGFLQGSLHEEIWLRRPPGFSGSFPAGTQWSLRRPVYGLCQAPREWHDTLRTTLAALGFTPSTADPSLFLRTDTSLPPFYVLVYVNDLVFATPYTRALILVKLELHKRHTFTDLGELRSYLGLQMTRDRARRTITLIQSHMVHQVFQRFGFQFSSPQPTPLSIGHSLSAPPLDESVEPSGPYRKLMGCLMYLMTCTRPDLAYPLSLLACYVAPGKHRKVHWEAAKRVLCYLCSTSGMGLVLGGRGQVVLTGSADASWVDNSATQRSSQGYTFSLGSGSVSWCEATAAGRLQRGDWWPGKPRGAGSVFLK
ncbi:unnamed protein product [Closterium sp. NIES-54]